MSQDQKICCLQACPCIIQPGHFTGWGSEGVNLKQLEYSLALAHHHKGQHKHSSKNHWLRQSQCVLFSPCKNWSGICGSLSVYWWMVCLNKVCPPSLIQHHCWYCNLLLEADVLRCQGQVLVEVFCNSTKVFFSWRSESVNGQNKAENEEEYLEMLSVLSP